MREVGWARTKPPIPVHVQPGSSFPQPGQKMCAVGGETHGERKRTPPLCEVTKDPVLKGGSPKVPLSQPSAPRWPCFSAQIPFLRSRPQDLGYTDPFLPGDPPTGQCLCWTGTPALPRPPLFRTPFSKVHSRNNCYKLLFRTCCCSITGLFLAAAHLSC